LAADACFPVQRRKILATCSVSCGSVSPAPVRQRERATPNRCVVILSHPHTSTAEVGTLTPCGSARGRARYQVLKLDSREATSGSQLISQRAGIGLSCAISVAVQLAGRVSPQRRNRLTQGCAIFSKPPATERQTICMDARRRSSGRTAALRLCGALLTRRLPPLLRDDDRPASRCSRPSAT
jgi:hypothetical protein